MYPVCTPRRTNGRVNSPLRPVGIAIDERRGGASRRPCTGERPSSLGCRAPAGDSALGTKRSSGAPDAPEAPETIGGPSRTRTLDPLIKRHRTAVREIKHFSCRRHVPHGLRSLSKWHVSHKGKILAPTSTGFSPQISPQLWATVVASANDPQGCCFGSESAEGAPEGRWPRDADAGSRRLCQVELMDLLNPRGNVGRGPFVD